MSRRLILVRHAKSSWSMPGLADHARPLNKRGRKSARAVGAWLKAQSHIPDEILCSTASRTRETRDLFAFDCETRFLDSLYHADTGDMLDVLRGATGRCVLLLGHNPGIGNLARCLVTAPPAHPRFADYPTCATLVAEFDINDWHDLRPASGRVAAFIIPRELAR